MDLVTTLLLAAGLALDAFAVSIACGTAFDRRHHLAALRIALAFGVFQGLMPVAGWLAGRALRDALAAVDHWVAFALLAWIGSHMIVEAVRQHRDGTPPRLPDARRVVALATATSLDALAAGLALAVLRVPIAVPAAVIAAVTLVGSYGGIVLGHELERVVRGRLRRDVQIAGGAGLILVGARILLAA